MTCDVRLSVVDGPLVDANFSVRVYEPFIIWGFAYQPDTDIDIQFDNTNSIFISARRATRQASSPMGCTASTPAARAAGSSVPRIPNP